MSSNYQIPPAILEQIKSGNKIDAVKMLRKELNISLIEAKELVDKVSAGDNDLGINLSNKETVSVSEKALEFLREGKKIDAIKVVREETGLGLKDSKELVEKVLEENSEVNQLYSAQSRAGVKKFLFIVSFMVLIYLIYQLIK